MLPIIIYWYNYKATKNFMTKRDSLVVAQVLSVVAISYPRS